MLYALQSSTARKALWYCNSGLDVCRCFPVFSICRDHPDFGLHSIALDADLQHDGGIACSNIGSLTNGI